MRTAHYVVSTHWDREWYEPLQGFRMRLVSMLDEVFDMLEREPAFKTFTMDGQVIPILDYLEVRPDREALVRQHVRDGRLKLGPWYVLPDEWIVSGESIVRNLQFGMKLAADFGAPTSRAGFVCDQFGHISQLPQIFSQLGIPVAYVWRGTHESEHHGHFLWKSPDGSAVPTYRFGPVGYCTFAYHVRRSNHADEKFDAEAAVQRVVDFTLAEAKRSPLSPILIFDGGDHLEIEPTISQVIARANEKLAAHDIRIVHSDFDRYQEDVLRDKKKIEKTLVGELRDSAKGFGPDDEQWVIPGVYSSRIHLKQRNAACEDELTLWAEPFSAFASAFSDVECPADYLRLSWKHLIDNHPHDSMCGCSPDQVHQDMIYRFDQSLGISSRLTRTALCTLLRNATASADEEHRVRIGVFNPTQQDIDEPVDIDVRLPTNWPTKFQEFFGFEEKFSFKLLGPGDQEIPYQLISIQRDRMNFRRPRYKFPVPDARHVVGVTARIKVPACGYTTLAVVPNKRPTRYLGSMATSHHTIENELLKLIVSANGTISIIDKKTNQSFSDLLTFEQRADIGDGWYHGVAVNDQIFVSTASPAEVALVADGPYKATLRIAVTMNVPDSFDFKTMTRSSRTKPLRIVSDVTLRKDADSVEVVTTIDNTILDHRVRVLFPTGLASDAFFTDSAFDVVERSVRLPEDNAARKELDVETRPQHTWCAIHDENRGLAVISRGLPEVTVRDASDRPIALTLLRSFRRAVFANENFGGQIQGTHTFHYRIQPFTTPLPTTRLSLLGQRVLSPARVVDLLPIELDANAKPSLPRTRSFLRLDGDAVVTSIQRQGDNLLVRMFNPTPKASAVSLGVPFDLNSAQPVTLEGQPDSAISPKISGKTVALSLPARRIATLLVR